LLQKIRLKKNSNAEKLLRASFSNAFFAGKTLLSIAFLMPLKALQGLPRFA